MVRDTILPTPAPDRSLRMPDELRSELYSISRFSSVCRKAGRKATVSYWALKIPAIVFSASGGVIAYLDQPFLALMSGAVASVCVLIDGLQPRGRQRNTYVSALHELRNMEAKLKSEWGVAKLVGRANNETAAKIITAVQPELRRIEESIRLAATSVQEEQQSSPNSP